MCHSVEMYMPALARQAADHRLAAYRSAAPAAATAGLAARLRAWLKAWPGALSVSVRTPPPHPAVARPGREARP